VKRLALFHHDPLRDAAVERLADLGRQRVAARGGTLEVFAAAEDRWLSCPRWDRARRVPWHPLPRASGEWDHECGRDDSDC
jgi:hypothetical protein